MKMDTFQLAITQLEVAYIHAKLVKLTDENLAVTILSDWLDVSEETTEKLVQYCSGVRYPAHTAAHLYQALGFTYIEISKFIGKSTPTITQYLKREAPNVLTTYENTPFHEEAWTAIREALDHKRQEMTMFGFRAKESIF